MKQLRILITEILIYAVGAFAPLAFLTTAVYALMLDGYNVLAASVALAGAFGTAYIGAVMHYLIRGSFATYKRERGNA